MDWRAARAEGGPALGEVIMERRGARAKGWLGWASLQPRGAGGILEREAELSVLDDAIQAAAAGDGSVVLVFGEAGIGKSSLVEAVRAQLPAEGRMFVGYCDDLATPRTLGPFRDLVGSVGSELSRAVLDGGDRDRILAALRAELKSALRGRPGRSAKSARTGARRTVAPRGAVGEFYPERLRAAQARLAGPPPGGRPATAWTGLAGGRGYAGVGPRNSRRYRPGQPPVSTRTAAGTGSRISARGDQRA